MYEYVVQTGGVPSSIMCVKHVRTPTTAADVGPITECAREDESTLRRREPPDGISPECDDNPMGTAHTTAEQVGLKVIEGPAPLSRRSRSARLNGGKVSPRLARRLKGLPTEMGMRDLEHARTVRRRGRRQVCRVSRWPPNAAHGDRMQCQQRQTIEPDQCRCPLATRVSRAP